MKFHTAFLLVTMFSGFADVYAQDSFLDTFIRKDGIYAVPPFEPRQPATLFPVNAKRRTSNVPRGMDTVYTNRIRRYINPAFGKTEPYSYFSVVRDLEGHDSSLYHEQLTEYPTDYRSFFGALYLVEANEFEKAVQSLTKLSASIGSDSLLLKETIFWRDAAALMLADQKEYETVLELYKALEHPSPEKAANINALASGIHLPQYLFDKYFVLYNYSFRTRDYKAAVADYDSLLTYTPPSKMRNALAKNRDAVLEVLSAKARFVDVMRQNGYFFGLDAMYDHLDAWGGRYRTEREMAEQNGFVLSQKYTTATDSVFTRWLRDTAETETRSKFEVLSFSRTALDKAGRRFVIVKLGFDNAETYQHYQSALQDFRSKPIWQSILNHKGKRIDGNEYMLTSYFIAALYEQDDPLIRYELVLYLLEDAEGNAFAVDTLF